MNKVYRIFYPLMLIVFFTSCDVQEVELVAVDKIELVSMKNNVLAFDVSATLDNPNSFSIKMLDSDLDLYLENKLMGKAHLTESINIKKNATETYKFKVETDVIDQGKLLPLLIQTALTGKIKVGVKGDVKGKVYFITRKVKVEMEDVVSIKDDILNRRN